MFKEEDMSKMYEDMETTIIKLDNVKNELDNYDGEEKFKSLFNVNINDWFVKYIQIDEFINTLVNRKESMDYHEFRGKIVDILTLMREIFPDEFVEINMNTNYASFNKLIAIIYGSTECNDEMCKIVNSLTKMLNQSGFGGIYFKRKGICKDQYYVMRSNKPKLFK